MQENETRLASKAEAYGGYTNAYASLPENEEELRKNVAGKALNEYRSFFEALNEAVTDEMERINELQVEFEAEDGDRMQFLQREIDSAFDSIIDFRRSAYELIGLEVEEEILRSENQEVEDDRKRFEEKTAHKLKEVKTENLDLYESIRERLRGFIGPLNEYEEAIVRTFALYADTGVQIKRSLVLESNGIPKFNWSENKKNKAYGRAHSFILHLIERSCTDLIIIQKHKLSEKHKSGGFFTYKFTGQVEESQIRMGTE